MSRQDSLWNATRGRNVFGADVASFPTFIPGTDQILPMIRVCTEPHRAESEDFVTSIWAWTRQSQAVAERLVTQIAVYRRAFICASQFDSLTIQVSPNHQLIIINDEEGAAA